MVHNIIERSHNLITNQLRKSNHYSELMNENKSDPVSFLTGDAKRSWQPIMTADTTTTSYWLNWRVAFCTIWVIISMVFASFIIYKFEGYRRSKNEERENRKEEDVGLLYEDEVWKPCLKSIHPGWLLGFRVFAFVVLLALLIVTVFVDGGSILYFYTQWTFTLITVYFGLGSLLSMYGCYQYHYQVSSNMIHHDGRDAEQGSNSTHINIGNSFASNMGKSSATQEEYRYRKIAGFWGYVFQIIFQMNAGAVMLTDCVFWFIIVPFLTIKDYNLNFLIINMHSINAVFLLGDTALNSLRFPWFRIAYFFMWTCVYVTFQWILHACVSLWWPYPFLDLSSPFAPLWYSSVAFMHIPCFGIFALIMKFKHYLLLRWFPQSINV